MLKSQQIIIKLLVACMVFRRWTVDRYPSAGKRSFYLDLWPITFITWSDRGSNVLRQKKKFSF